MYKIEKFLIDMKYKKVREYDSGVIVYSDADQEYEYVTEIVLFTKHDPIAYEITIRNPFAITVDSLHKYSKKFWQTKTSTHRYIAKDYVSYAKDMLEWFKEQVPDPWEEVKE